MGYVSRDKLYDSVILLLTKPVDVTFVRVAFWMALGGVALGGVAGYRPFSNSILYSDT